MTYREARSKDVAELAEMLHAEAAHEQEKGGHFRLSSTADWEGHVRRRMSRANEMIVVAEEDGHLAGFVNLRIIELGRQAGARGNGGWFEKIRRKLRRGSAQLSPLIEPMRNGFVDDIYVVPAFRKQGVAQRLLQEGIDWLKRRRVESIEASILVRNEASLNLFRKAGFEAARFIVWRASAVWRTGDGRRSSDLWRAGDPSLSQR